MADKYTKKPAPDATVAHSHPAAAWKDASVEKESQPPKVKSSLTYRQLEAQVADCDAQIASAGERKTAIQAEMAKVKSAVEA